MDKILENVLEVKKILLEKKGIDVKVYDCDGKVDYTSFIIVSSSVTDKHSQALYQEIYEKIKKRGQSPLSVEGEELGRWIIMDYNDFVVHIFLSNIREYYEFDELFKDFKVIE